ncbi:response regulator transcription factor [Microbispora sp. RL4-1S]|uniref:Response regulator transcription factor n=1 Tax=Microbispora oryzae TaxID=2806554 RepID=A0A940WLI8_9ACTN|nr:response regulator transcription factor [Microbispora oryzae]MBP2702789.1 response regulator transcription factor [Microbispora oryzae]
MRVIIADDTALIRVGVSALLRESDIEVVAAMGDVSTLLADVRRHRPDAVIMDIRMPPTYTDEGLVMARKIQAELPEVGVLLLSLHLEAEYALDLINEGRGRSGYLLKERLLDPGDLVQALLRINDGEAVIDPAIVEALMSRQRTTTSLHRLTPREREVLALMAEGLTNQAIGQRLNLSRKTVETHVTSLLDRLDIPAADGLHRRVLAVLAFLSSGHSPGHFP